MDFFTFNEPVHEQGFFFSCLRAALGQEHDNNLFKFMLPA